MNYILLQVVIIDDGQDAVGVQLGAKTKEALWRKEIADNIDADKSMCIVTGNIDYVNCLTFYVNMIQVFILNGPLDLNSFLNHTCQLSF